jgi:hypothetical protein
MRKILLTAAVIALGLAGTASPSLAQMGPWHPGYPGNTGPNAEFSLQFGYGPGFHRQRTLTNAQIRYRLRQQGYHDIRFHSRTRLTVAVRAEDRRSRDWILTVSLRTGHVLNRQALYRPFRGPGPGPGLFFGFQL